MHKTRAAARKAAWYHEEGEPKTYNPFGKIHRRPPAVGNKEFESTRLVFSQSEGDSWENDQNKRQEVALERHSPRQYAAKMPSAAPLPSEDLEDLSQNVQEKSETTGTNTKIVEDSIEETELDEGRQPQRQIHRFLRRSEAIHKGDEEKASLTSIQSRESTSGYRQSIIAQWHKLRLKLGYHNKGDVQRSLAQMGRSYVQNMLNPLPLPRQKRIEIFEYHKTISSTMRSDIASRPRISPKITPTTQSSKTLDALDLHITETPVTEFQFSIAFTLKNSASFLDRSHLSKNTVLVSVTRNKSPLFSPSTSFHGKMTPLV